MRDVLLGPEVLNGWKFKLGRREEEKQRTRMSLPGESRNAASHWSRGPDQDPCQPVRSRRNLDSTTTKEKLDMLT
jgi:hypothetical protein